MVRKAPNGAISQTVKTGHSQELQKTIVVLRDTLNQVLNNKINATSKNNSSEIQKSLDAIYTFLLKFLHIESPRDIDFVVLNPEIKPETCFGVGGHPTDSRKQIDMWVKGNEDNGISLAFNSKGEFILKKTQDVGDRNILTIDAIPNLIRLFCTNGIASVDYKVVKGRTNLVCVDERMHLLAQRPPLHHRKFYTVLKSINAKKQNQEKLKETYDFLQDLINSEFGQGLKYSEQMLILDGRASSSRDEGLVHIEQHGGIIEIGIFGDAEHNVVIYHDISDGLYKIKKIGDITSKDLHIKSGGNTYEKLIKHCRLNKLLEIDAIPGLIRDLMDHDFRQEGLLKFGITPNTDSIKLLDKLLAERRVEQNKRKYIGTSIFAMDSRMHALAQQPPRHLRQFNIISEGANELGTHQKELSDIFQYLEALCRDNGIIDNKEILEIDLHPDYVHATKKFGLICIRKNGALFELGTTGESGFNVVFYRDNRGIYCIRKCGAKSSFSKNRRNKLLGVEAISGPIRDFMKYEGRLEEAKISLLIRDPKKKFSEFTHIGIFSCDAVPRIQVLGPKINEVATPTGIDEATGLDKF